MFKNLEKLISFIFKSIKWLLMIGFLVVIYIVGKSLLMTSEHMDQVSNPTYTPTKKIEKKVKKETKKVDNCPYYRKKILNHRSDISRKIDYRGNVSDEKGFLNSCKNINLYLTEFKKDKCLSDKPIDNVVSTTEMEDYLKNYEITLKNCSSYKEQIDKRNEIINKIKKKVDKN